MQIDALASLYEPASQIEHFDAELALYLPPSHSEQLVAPALLYVPALHPRQSSWPVADWYVPAKHSEHALELLRLAKNPAAHAEQSLAPRDGISVPLGHGKQSSTESWRATTLPLSLRYLPAGHKVHRSAPVALLYLPSPHIVQEVASAALYVPTGQGSHPRSTKYSPASQRQSLKEPLQSSQVQQPISAPSCSVMLEVSQQKD